MVRTESTMPELGEQAPGFSLPNTNPEYGGEIVSLNDFSAKKALLVMFICNHCPYVVRIREGLSLLASDYQNQDIGIVAICANDAMSYPDDNPEKMTEEAQQQNYRFPYLYDETQNVAKTYRAACTPDFFLYDQHRRLVYRGQFDKARPGNEESVTGEDLRAAINNVLSDETVPSEQIPSMGCNIKWKSGQEPDYFG